MADVYATTAASMVDIRTLTSAGIKRTGGRPTYGFYAYLTSLNNSLNRPTTKKFPTIQLKQ